MKYDIIDTKTNRRYIYRHHCGDGRTFFDEYDKGGHLTRKEVLIPLSSKDSDMLINYITIIR